MTPNQVVAWNLQFARAIRGWKQEEAAERLEPYLGKRWSKATYSAAERSIAGKRIREFNANDIVAFARAFELPIAWFFMPPIHDPWRRLPLDAPQDTTEPTVDASTLVDLLLLEGDDASLRPEWAKKAREDLLERLAGCWPQLTPEVRARYAESTELRRRGLYPSASDPIDPNAKG